LLSHPDPDRTWDGLEGPQRIPSLRDRADLVHPLSELDRPGRPRRLGPRLADARQPLRGGLCGQGKDPITTRRSERL
jgi:hypothetical protein